MRGIGAWEWEDEHTIEVAQERQFMQIRQSVPYAACSAKTAG